MEGIKQTQSIKTSKDLSLEVMRIIAIIFVIFNHTKGFWAFTECELGSFGYFLGLFLSVFCKFSVPLFFMISGALLLKKQEPLSVILKKRFLRMFIVLVGFSILGCLLYASSISNFMIELVFAIYSGNTFYTLWFIFAYMTFLLLLPFLRMIAQKLNWKLFKYILALYIIFKAILPIFQFLILQDTVSISEEFLILSSDTIVYPLVGYFLYNKVDFSKIKNNIILVFWCINIAFIIITSLLIYYKMLKPEYRDSSALQPFFTRFTAINSITIFITIKKFVIINNSGFFAKLIKSAGECTFGIYLIHILPIFYFNFLYSKNIFYTLLLSLGYSMLLFLGCWLITFILRKIPLVKKFI